MTTGRILGNTYVLNGIAANVSTYRADASADIYYEVVRLFDTRIPFLADHLDRLVNSLSGSGVAYPGNRIIIENLRILISENDQTIGNIRICIQKTPEKDPDLLCYFVPYLYPEQCMYLSGVQVVTYKHERPNPMIKKWDGHFRGEVQKHIMEYGVYEAILVNERREVTEGSRSNLFFIDKSNRLVTPPENAVLPGITRKYVLAICRELGIEVAERPILLSEAEDLVSCFISGTSPKILPVWQLDAFQFQVDHPLLKQIMEQFEGILENNLETIL